MACHQVMICYHVMTVSHVMKCRHVVTSIRANASRHVTMDCHEILGHFRKLEVDFRELVIEGGWRLILNSFYIIVLCIISS